MEAPTKVLWWNRDGKIRCTAHLPSASVPRSEGWRVLDDVAHRMFRYAENSTGQRLICCELCEVES